MGRVSAQALLHVNLLLMVFAGAALSAAARLKWDPTAYVPLRELFPQEYRAAAALLPALGGVLLLLAHVALVALRCRRAARRALLALYAVGMLAALWAEGAWAAWAAWRVRRWARTPHAAQLAETLALREHLQPLLAHLARFHALPEQLARLLREAEADVPRGLRVALGAAALLASLQLLAAVLALREAALSSRPRRGERARLRAVYRHGRLVAL